jgi:FXSXX-COOH protein
MAELTPDVGSRLFDVTDSPLTDLAQLDSTVLDAALGRLLPQTRDVDDRPCSANASRLWQNY